MESEGEQVTTAAILDDDLLCHAFRTHAWAPTSAQAGVAGGARVWDWELTCARCSSRATEWRDNYDVRLPGTQRQYQLTESYKQGTGYEQGEYWAEIRRRPHLFRQALTAIGA